MPARDLLIDGVASLQRLTQSKRKGPRVFGLGAAKTGTHSIAAIFKDRLRAAHEVDSDRLIALYLDGERDALRRYLLRRDWMRNLDVDASQINIYLLPELQSLFPGSKFIVTIREPVRWLRSIIDDSLRRDVPAIWHRFRDHRFGPKATDGPLADAGLYTVEGYLRYWASSVSVIDQVPTEDTLIVRTSDIGPRFSDIARFVGAPDPDIPPGESHAFRNTERAGLLEALDEAAMLDAVDVNCGDLARRHLPGWEAAADWAATRAQP